MRCDRAAPQKTCFKSGHSLSLMSIVVWRTIQLIKMVNRANQAGIVAVTDGIEIVGNAEPSQMLAQ